MLKTRVIPVLFLMNGMIVRSESFSEFKVIGNPVSQLERLNDWLADELVYIDITREGDHDIGRSDHKFKGESDVVSILRQISKRAFMPLTFGGRIGKLEDVDHFIRNGADKVVINSAVYRNPRLISDVAEKYGSQAMMIGIDVRHEVGRHVMYVDQGRTSVTDDPAAYARKAEAAGAGEILLNSIDRDGSGRGYDLEIVEKVAAAVTIPVIACGGVGMFEHFGPAIAKTSVSAVAAGNIFHFTENAYRRAKRQLHGKGHNVRYPYEG